MIINIADLAPKGYKSRTATYIFASLVTFGINGLVASVCNLTFDPKKERNI